MQEPSDVSVPKIDVKEGTRDTGYGERFDVSLVSGMASLSLPVQAPQVRDSGPEVALRYGGGRQNGPFGLGFSLDVGSISRRTDKGVPCYDRTDRFLLDGRQLTARYVADGDAWIKDERCEGDHTVIAYRPRVEETFDRIEWWIADGDGSSFWKVVDADNGTTLYGADADSRIADPAMPENIFRWMISEHSDALGNRTVYAYKRENDEGVPAGDEAPGAQLYVRSIRYGPYPAAGGGENFAVEILFDYGEYDLPSLTPVRPWAMRQDPFSTYRPGFDLRTRRLCRNIMTVHHFPDEPVVGTCLTQVLALTYDETPVFSSLAAARRVGWRKETSGRLVSEARPPMRFAFAAFDPGHGRFRDLSVSGRPPFPGLPGQGFGQGSGKSGGGHYQFSDLYGDGIPGMLYNDASVLAYWRALGDGRYQPPLPPASFPTDDALSEGRCTLMDVAGNGHLDLVVQTPRRAGFYRNNNDGNWETFVPFASNATEMTAEGRLVADLDGDGRQDMMIAAGTEHIRVYESRGTAGFGPPGLRPVAPDFPSSAARSLRAVHTFADVFGDGLEHRVKITDGALIAWPSLGYGRFGNPVMFANVPRFGPDLTAARIFLADVDGSGLADLVYVYPTHLAIHFNQSGNGFSAPLIVAVPQRVDDLDQVNWADVFGDGMRSFVLSKAAAQVTHHALSFASDEVPYLLKTIDNGYGATTHLTYRSSTHFQLADRRAGRPWPTPLATVTQVVDTTVIVDATTGLTSTRRYQYADGYFDPVEREFRGFAYVQSLDSQVFQGPDWHFPAQAPETGAMASAEPPVEAALTKRWNNTGAAALVEARSVPLPRYEGALLVPPDVLAPEILAIGGETVREAYRALKDHEAAQSVTGVGADGTPKATAYQTSAQTYLVTLLQPRIGGNPAAFQVTRRQSRVMVQDGASDEARLSDAYTLALDAYGNATLSAAIAYPRKPVDGDLLPPQQTATLVTARQQAFINHPDTTAEPFRYIGRQWEERVLEVDGIDGAQGLLDFATVERLVTEAVRPSAVIPFGTPFTPGTVQSRPYRWIRDLYWDATRTAALPPGQIAAQGLLFEQRKAVFSEDCVTAIYGERVDAATLEASDGRGAGLSLEAGYWWNPGTRRGYGDAASYYSLVTATDPYGAVTTFGYDPFWIEMTSSTDALGQETRLVIDYQALKPSQVVDVNDNTTETVYGPLGMMVVFSRYGEVDGQPVGDRPLGDYVYVTPAGRDEVLAEPETFLQGAGSYYWEDMAAVAEGRGPVSGILIEADRAEFPADPQWDPPPRRYGYTVTYVDGAMRTLCRQDKVEAAGVEEGGVDDGNGDGDDRWVVSDEVTYDAQGRVVRRYRPFVSLQPDFVARPDAPFVRDVHDALGRVVRSDKPPGFFTRTDYHAWERVVWDEDDTVTESPYYKANIGNTDPAFANQLDALKKAAVLADTPSTVFLDPLGRDILERRLEVFAPPGEQPGPPVPRETGTWRDIAGAVTRQADPRFYAGSATTLVNQETRYDMSGQAMSVTSTDVGKDTPGTRRQLFDALGNPLDSWDNRGVHVRRAYDGLRRPTGVFVAGNGGGGGDFQAESLEYGTDAAANTRNRIVLRRDQAEEARIERYGLTGQPTAETRRFPVAVGVPIDWRDPVSVSLLPETWRLGAAFNRRGWPLATVNADGSVQTTTYYLNGWCAGTALAATTADTPVPVMVSRRYSPAGKPSETVHGNGTTTRRLYDPATRRLSAVTTVRAADAAILQDDTITYDPVGNVTRIEHKTEVPDHWSNGRVDPLSDYTYDSLYRLRRATGRQQAGLAAPGARPVRGGDDPTRLVGYTETYTLDSSNNLTEIRHVALSNEGQGGWTRAFAVSMTSNHVVPAEMVEGGATPDDFYDLEGNLDRLPALSAMAFDYRNNLASATLVSRADGDDDSEAYAYAQSGERRRKVARRVQSGGTAVRIEETFYIGALVVTRVSVQSDGTAPPTDEGTSLGVSVGGERLLVVDTGQEEERPQWRYQVDNTQSSVVMELDETGQFITYEEFLPYGGMALAKGRSQLDLDRKRYRFIGRELDKATGFYRIGLRYYVPWMGRWLTPDPAGSRDGLNLYAYVGANPTSFVDRTGLTRTKLTGTREQVGDLQGRMDSDLDRAREMVDAAIGLLETHVASRNNWLTGTLWSRGSINDPDPLVSQYFGIRGRTRTEANQLFELLDNFKAIRTYLARPAYQSRLSWRYAQSFFVDVPQFNVLTDTAQSRNTIAYVQGASLNWPDWRILPPSVRSRPMGWATVIGGSVNTMVRAIRRFTPSAGINLYERAHFGDLDDNTRASTIVHESSHLLLGTDDHAYGFEEPKFSGLSPTETLYNADSYGLFARAVYERDQGVLNI